MSQKPSRKDWHRLFGVSLKGTFLHQPYQVELEMDMSVRQQFLDVVIVKKKEADDSLGDESTQRALPPLPDGLENLADHNLLTYKSMREPLDGWALDELVGHYVNYRKQTSPELKQLLPQKHFQLYAVSTRFPRGLHKVMPLTKRQAGVYEITWGLHTIRVIVLKRMPQAPQNALWNMFSSSREKVAYGSKHFQVQRRRVSSIINQLFEFYSLEGVKMPYTMEDFEYDYIEQTLLRHILESEKLQISFFEMMLKNTPHLQGTAFGEAWQTFLIDHLLPKLSLQERLRDVPVAERLRDVPVAERLRDVPVAERLKGLSPAEIEAYLHQHKAEESGDYPEGKTSPASAEPERDV